MKEFVSCVVPTRGRPHFLAQAIRCFSRQTYEPSELIVVDDGDQPVADLCSGLERVRYFRLNQATSTGMKLNIGIGQARGQIIQKLDDDDYYGPDFLRMAMDHFLRRASGRSLLAWDCFLILLAGQDGLRFSGHGWTAGGTLCFLRELWAKKPFRDVPRQVDTWFVSDHRPDRIKVCAPESYILVRHGRNTWTGMPGGKSVDEYLQEKPVYAKPLEAVIDPRDWEFYRSLIRKEPWETPAVPA